MANATVNLTSTTLSLGAGKDDSAIFVASTSGIVPGLRLYLDREMMEVLSLGLGTSVNVMRGRGGTAASGHAWNATVYMGRADQFYETDPVGLPPAQVLVSPWINALTGAIWTAQGDESGPGQQTRYWAQTVATKGTASLGVLTSTNAPDVTTAPV